MTDIQVETLRMVAEGHTNSEIAKQRFVSEKAVEQTVAKIAKALDIPAATGTGNVPALGRAYREEKGISLPHHMGALTAHEELKARAADEGASAAMQGKITEYYNR
jgi:hypothetical protein